MSRKPQPHRGAKLKRLQRQQQQRLEQLKLFLIVSVVVNVVLVGAAGMLAIERSSSSSGGTAQIDGLPETLPPENFDGRTREAYQVAREIPAVLDAIFCYCYCKEQHGHRSLLDCYVVEDAHASICDVCQDEALRAQELWDMDMPAPGPGGDGMAIQDISDKIDEEFDPNR